MATMATRFKRTHMANLDYAIDYDTYYGRVKIGGKVILECPALRMAVQQRSGAESREFRPI
jgi:hypothetical protein